MDHFLDWEKNTLSLSYFEVIFIDESQAMFLIMKKDMILCLSLSLFSLSKLFHPSQSFQVAIWQMLP